MVVVQHVEGDELLGTAAGAVRGCGVVQLLHQSHV